MCDAFECIQNDASAEESANKLNSSFSSTFSLSSTGTDSSKRDRRRNLFDDTSCKKCSRPNPSVKIHAQGSHCKDCFLSYFHHKFRSTIGREGVIPYGAQVVLAFSGGPSSTAMLKLTSDSLKEKKKAKLSFTIHVIHVNLQLGNISSEKTLKRMSSLCESLGLDLFVIEASEWVKTHSNFSIDDFFDSDDETLKLDREKNLIQTILRQYSSEKGFYWLMTGQSLFRSAVSALTEVAFGRGCNLGSICKFLDKRDSSVSIFYPVKEFTSKEIALFNHFNSLTSFKFSDLESGKSPNTSIQRLTEDFLLNLQIDFPAAVPNVRNSGDKMVARSRIGSSWVQKSFQYSTSSGVSTEKQECGLCLMPLDIQTLNPKLNKNARFAAQFSNNVCGLASIQDGSNSDATEKCVENICSFCRWDFNYV